ncbi:MAG: FkbM family methyltransferase [Planctomycetota bacterium]
MPTLPLPNGLSLTLKSAQQAGCARFIAREVFQRGVYIRPGFEIRPEDVIVDIGANAGVFALWASPMASRGRVICIEPTAVIECLEQSIRQNQLTNVTPIRCAISSSPGTLELTEYPGFNAVTHASEFQPAQWGQFFIKLLWRQHTAEPIRTSCVCRTLEDVLDEQSVATIDLLKVDCEGSEYAIFESISDECLSRVSKIVMEFHELHASHDHRILVQRLQKAGFDVDVRRTLVERMFLKTGMIWAIRRQSHAMEPDA